MKAATALPMVHYYRGASKHPVMVAKRHSSLAAYKKGHAKLRADSDSRRQVSVNESVPYHGARFDEYQYMQDGQRHIRLSGRELLGVIGTRDIASSGINFTYSAGDRFAVFPIAPDFLEGRVGRMAQEFEQHKLHALRVWWEPTVPTTTAGAIALYFYNDVGVPMVDTGLDEIAHAATHASFIQTPVFAPESLTIKPEDALNRYFDEESSDFRFEVQGIVVVEAASEITIRGGTSDPYPVTLGNVYVEYDFEFFGEVLDYSIPMKSYGEMRVLSNATVGAVIDGQPLIARVAATTAAGQQAITDIDFPSGVTSATDLLGWVFVGTVYLATGTSLVWYIVDDPAQREWEVGQGIVVRFRNFGTTVIAAFYADLASAGTRDDVGAIAGSTPTSGLAYYAASALGADAVFCLAGYWTQLN